MAFKIAREKKNYFSALMAILNILKKNSNIYNFKVHTLLQNRLLQSLKIGDYAVSSGKRETTS